MPLASSMQKSNLESYKEQFDLQDNFELNLDKLNVDNIQLCCHVLSFKIDLDYIDLKTCFHANC